MARTRLRLQAIYVCLFLTFFFSLSREIGEGMKKRFKLGGRSSRKLFTRTADGVHKRNYLTNPMRGGIRL